MPAIMNVNDLPSAMLTQLGIRKPKGQGFTKESVRSWSLKTLALLAELT